VNPSSVVIVHRDMMVAEGIAAALARYPGVLPIAIATTAEGAESAGEKADAIAIDEHVAGAEAAASRFRRRGIRVVFIGAEATEDDHGVRIPISDPVESLARALVPTTKVPTERQLTRREEQILSLVARGLAGKQVAAQLGISPKTVEQHKTRIFAKLGVQNQTAAACLVLSRRLGGTYS
jgi:DNA-binding CsgD family transcriptional regulator